MSQARSALLRPVVQALVIAGIVLFGSSAFAQAARTWVSGVGDDANPCSRVAPCKTFPGAIPKTAVGGEIDVLDPGAFGAVTITKSITIDGHGMFAGVMATGTAGITVSAGATGAVVLRGLSITCSTNTGCPANNGIRYISGLTLDVEDTRIAGFGLPAIGFAPVAAGPLLLVKRVTVSGNPGGGVDVGLAGVAAISQSAFFNDGFGLLATDTALVSVFDCVVSGNATIGVQATGTAAINMNRGLISGNGVGVQGDSTVRLADVMIGHNTTGVAGANVVSFGNNRITAGNTTDGAPSSTLPQQ